MPLNAVGDYSCFWTTDESLAYARTRRSNPDWSPGSGESARPNAGERTVNDILTLWLACSGWWVFLSDLRSVGCRSVRYSGGS